MGLLKSVVLLIVFGVFAAVILSTFVAVLMVWLARVAALLCGRKPKGIKPTAQLRGFADQEGV
jgi:hypothetical protein